MLDKSSPCTHMGAAQAHCVDTAAVVVPTGHAATVRTDQKDHVFTPFNIKVSTV